MKLKVDGKPVHMKNGKLFLPCHRCQTERHARLSETVLDADERGFTGNVSCSSCGAALGRLTASLDTIWGAREDQAVVELAHGRGWRVY